MTRRETVYMFALCVIATLMILGMPTFAVTSPGDRPRPSPRPSKTQGVTPTPSPSQTGGSGMVPLIDLAGTYKGLTGRLYEGTNQLPAGHDQEGRTQANQIAPVNGKIVLLALGMSNTTIEWCNRHGAWPGLAGGPTCDAASFGKLAWDDAQVEKSTLEIVNGAQSGITAAEWADSGNVAWTVVRNLLTQRGLTESQVQVIWMKHANRTFDPALPASNADAYKLKEQLGDILRIAKSRYPNLRLAFISSRIYAGYRTDPQPDTRLEPWAYETGFAVKWVVAAQINQLAGGPPDAQAGDLSLAVAPWIAWGPYLWANGATPNSQGLAWLPGDYQSDLVHPAVSGQRKVAERLLVFFKTSSMTTCWFLASGGNC